MKPEWYRFVLERIKAYARQVLGHPNANREVINEEMRAIEELLAILEEARLEPAERGEVRAALQVLCAEVTDTTPRGDTLRSYFASAGGKLK